MSVVLYLFIFPCKVTKKNEMTKDKSAKMFILGLFLKHGTQKETKRPDSLSLQN